MFTERSLKDRERVQVNKHNPSLILSSPKVANCLTPFWHLIKSEQFELQMEDIALGEGVQRGLESPAYCSGRYAPSIEMAMHYFHCLLHACLNHL